MTVKSWRPGKISSKSTHALVALDTPASDEENIQSEEKPTSPVWTTAQFPEVSSESMDLLKTKRGENKEPVNGSSSWDPSEIKDAFVVNRDTTSRFGRADGNNPNQSKYFDGISKKAENILSQTNSQAVEVIAKAEKQANEIIQQAENQAMQLTHQAYQDGLAAANAEISDLLKTARAIAEEVETWRENTLSKSEMMILRLVIEIAQSLFGEGIPLDPDTLGNAFSRALSQAKTLGDLRIYVHPEDSVALAPHWAQQQATFSGQRIELIPSDIIKRGGCFIEGQYGNVDARIETQLQMVKDTLLDTLSMPVEAHV
jgi:flagellar assembly protein FliH